MDLRTPQGEVVRIWRNFLDVGNSKVRKGIARGYLNAVHYMAPHNEAGGASVCPWAARCALPCLTFSGHGQFAETRKARIERTRLWFRDHAAYVDRFRKAIGLDPNVGTGVLHWAKRLGWKAAIRLNGTSDIEWEKYGILHEADAAGGEVLDYTKIAPRFLEWLDGKPVGRGNMRLGRTGAFRGLRYSLTFSLGGKVDLSPKHEASAFYQEVFDRGGNVAAVWGERIPSAVKTFLVVDQDGKTVKEIDLGRPRRVIDGDRDDLRMLDPRGVIVGLTMKGEGGGDTRKLDRGRVKFEVMHRSNPSSGVAVVTGLPMGMIAERSAPTTYAPTSRRESNPCGLPHSTLNSRLSSKGVGMPTWLARDISIDTGVHWGVWSTWKNGDLLNKVSGSVAKNLASFLRGVC